MSGCAGTRQSSLSNLWSEYRPRLDIQGAASRVVGFVRRDKAKSAKDEVDEIMAAKAAQRAAEAGTVQVANTSNDVEKHSAGNSIFKPFARFRTSKAASTRSDDDSLLAAKTDRRTRRRAAKTDEGPVQQVDFDDVNLFAEMEKKQNAEYHTRVEVRPTATSSNPFAELEAEEAAAAQPQRRKVAVAVEQKKPQPAFVNDFDSQLENLRSSMQQKAPAPREARVSRRPVQETRKQTHRLVNLESSALGVNRQRRVEHIKNISQPAPQPVAPVKLNSHPIAAPPIERPTRAIEKPAPRSLPTAQETHSIRSETSSQIMILESNRLPSRQEMRRRTMTSSASSVRSF